MVLCFLFSYYFNIDFFYSVSERFLSLLLVKKSFNEILLLGKSYALVLIASTLQTSFSFGNKETRKASRRGGGNIMKSNHRNSQSRHTLNKINAYPLMEGK